LERVLVLLGAFDPAFILVDGGKLFCSFSGFILEDKWFILFLMEGVRD
jgi:hypothetical protein